MKNSLTLLVVTIFLGGAFATAQSIQKWPFEIEIYPSGVVTIEDTVNDYIMIKPRNHNLIFHAQWATADQVRMMQEATMVVNAGYFGYADDTTRTEFIPAGSYPYGVENTASDLPCERDKNLCGRIDAGTLKVQTADRLVDDNVLNAWPMMMESWKVNTSVLQRQSHRLTPNYRTVLINTKKYGPFFFVTTKKRTLLEVAYIIQQWFPDATIINLDGWSSTSYSSSRDRYNDQKRLPTFFVLE